MTATHRKGSAWRHAVEQWFADAGFHTTVRGIGYSGDDVLARRYRPRTRADAWPSLVLSVEAKNHRAIELASFVDQAIDQARDYEDEVVLPVVVIHRKGKASVDDAYVVMPGAAFIELVTR
jgi:hypothetical protein